MPSPVRAKDVSMDALLNFKKILCDKWNMINALVAASIMSCVIAYVNADHPFIWILVAVVKQFLYTGSSTALYSHFIRKNVHYNIQKGMKFAPFWTILIFWLIAIFCAVFIHGVLPGTPEKFTSVMIGLIVTPFAIAIVATPTWYLKMRSLRS